MFTMHRLSEPQGLEESEFLELLPKKELTICPGSTNSSFR